MAYAEVVRLVRAAVEGDCYPLSPRANRQEYPGEAGAGVLEHAVAPYPAPRPSAEPSLLLSCEAAALNRTWNDQTTLSW